MTYFHPDWLEGQRQRWMRPDWQRYVRPDWRRYVKPGYELDHRGVLVESKAEPEWRRKAEAGGHAPERDVRDMSHAEWTRHCEIRRVRADLAAWRLQRAARRYFEFLRKANFNPSQPRVPAGDPAGGQWTAEGIGTEGSVRDTEFSANRRRRIGGRGTPAQQARFTVARARAESATRELRRLDPNWKPTESLTAPGSIEGDIALLNARAAEAEARLDVLNRLGIASETLQLDAPSRSHEKILLPGGRLVGVQMPGASDEVYTVARGEFQSLRNELMAGSRPVSTPPQYKGLWFERSDGMVFGLRLSQGHGPTIDVISGEAPSIPRNLRIHQK